MLQKQWQLNGGEHKEGMEMAEGEVPLSGKKSLTPDKAYIKAHILYRTSRCRHCGRILRNEDSIARGAGLTCAAYFGHRFLVRNKTFLGVRAKGIWSKKEIDKLVTHAKNGGGE